MNSDTVTVLKMTPQRKTVTWNKHTAQHSILNETAILSTLTRVEVSALTVIFIGHPVRLRELWTNLCLYFSGAINNFLCCGQTHLECSIITFLSRKTHRFQHTKDAFWRGRTINSGALWKHPTIPHLSRCMGSVSWLQQNCVSRVCQYRWRGRGSGATAATTVGGHVGSGHTWSPVILHINQSQNNPPKHQLYHGMLFKMPPPHKHTTSTTPGTTTITLCSY